MVNIDDEITYTVRARYYLWCFGPNNKTYDGKVLGIWFKDGKVYLKVQREETTSSSYMRFWNQDTVIIDSVPLNNVIRNLSRHAINEQSGSNTVASQGDTNIINNLIAVLHSTVEDNIYHTLQPDNIVYDIMKFEDVMTESDSNSVTELQPNQDSFGVNVNDIPGRDSSDDQSEHFSVINSGHQLDFGNSSRLTSSKSNSLDSIPNRMSDELVVQIPEDVEYCSTGHCATGNEETEDSREDSTCGTTNLISDD